MPCSVDDCSNICCLLNLPSTADRRAIQCSKQLILRQIVSVSHILHCLLPTKRDDEFTGRMRSTTEHLTLRTCRNCYKNLFIPYEMSSYYRLSNWRVKELIMIKKLTPLKTLTPVQSSKPQNQLFTKRHATYRSLRSVHPSTLYRTPKILCIYNPRVINVPWTHPTHPPKLHLHQFSCFCSAHGRAFLHFTMSYSPTSSQYHRPDVHRHIICVSIYAHNMCVYICVPLF